MKLDLLSLTHPLVPIIISSTVPVVLVCKALCNRLVQNWLHKQMLNKEDKQCFTWKKSAYSAQLKHDCGSLVLRSFRLFFFLFK